MANLLLSGPAGAGKTQEGKRQVLQRLPAILVDFQAIYAAILGIERDPETNRYPERLLQDDYALPLAEYTRRAIITGAVERDLTVIATNSDGNAARRLDLIGFLGPGATETVIDPGIGVVTQRLSVNGQLSRQCGDAIQRWYGRL